jgi:Tol biopolymer transport system component
MKNVLIAVIALSVIALAASTVLGQGGHDLFQKALVKERAEGDLQEAIDIYRRIVREFGADRALAAEALVHMGQCYEKLGDEEARKAYEQVVREYADQAEPLRVARSRLAELTGPSPTALTVRRLENPPPAAWIGEPSPDGRYLSCMDWQIGDLTVRDLRTGKDRRLTNESTSYDQIPNTPVFQQAGQRTWSPDSNQIAYEWSIGNRATELRIIRLDGGKPRVLSHYENGETLASLDWSPDGRQILATLNRVTGPREIVLISTADGSSRPLAAMMGEISPRTRFSPDGRHIVYDAQTDETGPERDIFLLSIDTGQVTPLIRHPADDFLLGWSADGKWLVFASDRTGAIGLWVVGVAGGKTQGAPRLVKPGTGPILPMGLTREGALYYGVARATEDVYVADLDSKTGKVISSPRKAIERYEGGNYSPSYSPDGKHLAYVSRRGSYPLPTNIGNTLCIRSLETGQERVFYKEIWRLGLRTIGRLSWSPDGRFIAFRGRGRTSRTSGAYSIDLGASEITPVVRCGPEEAIYESEHGPGGKYFLARGNRKNGFSQIVAHDLKTGEEWEFYRFPRFEVDIGIELSPDGRWLSFLNAGWNAVRSLRIMPVSGGDAREVWSFGETKQGAQSLAHTWSPDGRYILFGAPDPSDRPRWELLRVPVEGGKPEKLGLRREGGIRPITVHPDGRQLAFASRSSYTGSSEVWVMENFLPEQAAARR